MACALKNPVSKALVIDDSGIDLKMVNHILCWEGFAEQVYLFQNAASALTYLEHECDSWPEVIFLDLSMPEMDGYEFLEYYQNFSDKFIKHCPVVILSSSGDKYDIRETKKYKGVIKYIKKPLNVTDLKKLKKESGSK